ncbi:hypothetical protein FOZ60_014177 [Perkinsus olseni]|uniref:Uncharacterized protein n=1 Tax=Perkinsus olseni TaxID=32597 RepID=A0A7J6N7Y3_PEROL|nr:hypothetical protein FOZ60_014177 [Perkinsus olseni]
MYSISAMMDVTTPLLLSLRLGTLRHISVNIILSSRTNLCRIPFSVLSTSSAAVVSTFLQDRENQTRCVRRLGQALSRIRKLWVKRMPTTIRAFCAHLHLPLMLVLLRRAGYADWRLPAELVFGLAVHGRFSVPGNVFAPQSTERWTFKASVFSPSLRLYPRRPTDNASIFEGLSLGMINFFGMAR